MFSTLPLSLSFSFFPFCWNIDFDFVQIILNVFDTDIESQPVAIVDMGCGDGSLLRRLFDTIKEKTKRGDMLQAFPLLLIGVDINKAALFATEENSTGYPIITLHGDIGNPSALKSELTANGIDPEKVIHVRSFLDHDRPFSSLDFQGIDYQSDVRREWWVGEEEQGKNGGDSEFSPQPIQSKNLTKEEVQDWSLFIDEAGLLIPFPLMYSHLVQHLRKWKHVVSPQYGLIVLEVHSLPPSLVEKYCDQTESLHFDVLQILSRQCLVEAATFHRAMGEAGLFASDHHHRHLAGESLKKYPKSLSFSRITLGHYFPQQYRIRCAEKRDLNDLCHLERECWSEQLGVSKDVLNRRLDRYPTGQFVLEVGKEDSCSEPGEGDWGFVYSAAFFF